MTEPKIKIKMLGKFEICVDGQPALPLLEQSRKALLLVQYLLLKYGKRVGHKELIDAVWGGDNSTNPDMALRAITHRYRNMAAGTLLENSIRTSRGAYEWNTDLAADIDVYTMQDLLEKAEKAADNTKRIELYAAALDLYGGKLLPASAGEAWVERRSVQLHARYRAALFTLLELYKQTGNYEAFIARCRRSLEIDAYDERLYVELILALQQVGKPEEAEHVTQCAAERGCLHATENPRNLQGTYKRIRRAENAIEGDIARIAENICAGGDRNVAYFCDYTTFAEIFRVQMRLYERYGVAPFLALTTISPPNKSSETELAAAMDLLGEIIQNTLRHNDVVARYSANQYVLLLFGGSGMTAGNPMERIKTEFYSRPEHGHMGLSYRLHTPDIPASKSGIVKHGAARKHKEK